MERSPSITNLTQALAKFHAMVGKISKDAKNPFFKSTLQAVRNNDPQAQASAISYARRYATSSVMNLQISDDDAEAATRPVRHQPVPTKLAPTEEQFAYIVRYLNGTDAQKKQAKEAMSKYTFNKDQQDTLDGLI